MRSAGIQEHRGPLGQVILGGRATRERVRCIKAGGRLVEFNDGEVVGVVTVEQPVGTAARYTVAAEELAATV